MNYRQLEIFIAICRTGSVTDAAKALFLSQPAVSKALRELEASLQTKLFDRLSNRLYLTPDGELFLPKAQQLVSLQQDILQTMRDPQRPLLLRIGTSITLGADVLPQIMTKMAAGFPQIRLEIVVDNVKQIQQQLRRNDIDIALIEGLIDRSQFQVMPFSHYDLGVVCGAAYPIQPTITIEELLDQPLFLRETGSSLRDLFDAFLTIKGFRAIPQLVSVNSQVLIACVEENLGLTVLPLSMIAAQLAQGRLKVVTVTGMSLRSANHLVLQHEKTTPAIAAFVKTALECRVQP